VSSLLEIVYPEAGPDEFQRIVDANPLQAGHVFSSWAYLGAQEAMKTYMRNNGYYAAEITPSAWLYPKEYSVDVTYLVFEGPRVRFGETVIEGLEEVDPHIVRREIAWREGDWYEHTKVKETISRLHELRLFRSVRIEPVIDDDELGMDDEVLPMRIMLREAPPQTFRVGVGYGTEDRFRIQALHTHRNIFGGARQLRSVIRLSSLIQSTDVTFLQPHLFARDNFGTLSTAYRRERVIEAFTSERVSLTPRFNRRFGRHLNGFFGYLLEYNRAFDVAAPIPLEERMLVDPGVLSGLIAGVEYNTLDSPLFPTRGNVTRLNAMHAGAFMGGRFNFYRLTLETRQFVRISRPWIASFRILGGVADPYGDSRVPLYEKFYSGGDDSVRGYRRDRLGPAIGGLTLVETSAELQWRFRQIYGLAGFVDSGMVSLDPYTWMPENNRWGVGPGFRAETPVGVVRTDLGFALSPREEEPRWRFHFSLGQTF
jgi:outer membrane protein insertion porin family